MGELTIDMINSAAEQIKKQGYRPPERIISVAQMMLLEKIREIEPGWDDWTVSLQINLKARDLNIWQGHAG